MRKTAIATIIVLLILLIFPLSALSISWPLSPDSSSHFVAFYYGNWQGMWRQEWSRNVNYFHVGMDMPGEPLEPVVAVEPGYVKAMFTIFNGSEFHWRIVVADSSGIEECDGWLYAHIRNGGVYINIGDYVNAGDTIAKLVNWDSEFTMTHLHLSRVRYSGDETAWANGFWDYEFIGSALNLLGNTGDAIAPFMQNAYQNQLFAFCENQSANYFEIGEELSGDVDIICSAYDYSSIDSFPTSPYKIEYKIEGDSSLPWQTSFEFSGSVGSYNGIMEDLSKMVFKYDNVCNSTYSDSLTVYYIMTNTDGDGILELTDTNYCWTTTDFHNGNYKIFARLSDFDGNSFIDSMTVAVGNYFNFNLSVNMNDGNPYLSGTQITIAPDNISDTSNSLGELSIPDLGGGTQQIIISITGFSVFRFLAITILANSPSISLG